MVQTLCLGILGKTEKEFEKASRHQAGRLFSFGTKLLSFSDASALVSRFPAFGGEEMPMLISFGNSWGLFPKLLS
jgi:hypothetical protein